MSHVPAVQSTPPSSHAAVPEQVTTQEEPAQLTPASHASVPLHVMLQLVACRQLTTPVSHAREPTQLTSHGRPGGQVTPLRHCAAPQWMTQVPSEAQLLHAGGQDAASIAVIASTRASIVLAASMVLAASPVGSAASTSDAASSPLPDASIAAPCGWN
jgi:hypothetical protein